MSRKGSRKKKGDTKMKYWKRGISRVPKKGSTAAQDKRKPDQLHKYTKKQESARLLKEGKKLVSSECENQTWAQKVAWEVCGEFLITKKKGKRISRQET